jgi:hypothetical protein
MKISNSRLERAKVARNVLRRAGWYLASVRDEPDESREDLILLDLAMECARLGKIPPGGGRAFEKELESRYRDTFGKCDE